MPIGPISFNINSSKFLIELLTRRASFLGATAAYRITVPEDLQWWYYLEFGTAGRQDSSAPERTTHSGTYPIDPVKATALAIPDARVPNGPNGVRFAFHVDHPGIRPRLIYRGLRSEILTRASEAISKGFLQSGVRLASIDAAMMTDVMPHAVERMGQQLDQQAPGTRVDGKLGGESAGAVWRDEAQIIKV